MPTIEQVERTGEWVTAMNSGAKRHRVDWLRKTGLIDTAKDCKIVVVDLPAPTGGTRTKPVIFHRRSILQRLLNVDRRKAMTEKLKAWRKTQERLEIEGVPHFRIGAAAKFLGVHKYALQHWPTDGRHGIVLNPHFELVAGRTTSYYPLNELKKARESLDTFRAKEDGYVGLAEACKITGLSKWTLTDQKWCIDNRISLKTKRTYRVKRGQSARYWFLEADLIAFRQRPRTPIPEGRITASEAARRLGRSQTTIKSWCRNGILKAIRGRVPVGTHTHKIGWLLSVESVDALVPPSRRIITIPDECWTLEQAAEILGCTRGAVLWMCHKGRLQYRKGRTHACGKQSYLPLKVSVERAHQQGLGRGRWKHRRAVPETTPTTQSRPESTLTGSRPGLGRRRSALTDAIEKYCYERWSKGDKLVAIVAGVQAEFRGRGPKEKGHVRLYAKRYAQRNSLPINRPQTS